MPFDMSKASTAFDVRSDGTYVVVYHDGERLTEYGPYMDQQHAQGFLQSVVLREMKTHGEQMLPAVPAADTSHEGAS